MCLDAEIAKIPICRNSHGHVGVWMRGNIGVAGRVVVTYIKLPICSGVMVDFGCRPQDHGGSAMRTAEGPTALGSRFSFFQNSHLLFCVLLEFTQKNRGVPPVGLKENL